MYPATSAHCHIVLLRMAHSVSPFMKVTTTTGPSGVLGYRSNNEGYMDTAHWCWGLTKSLLAVGAFAKKTSMSTQVDW